MTYSSHNACATTNPLRSVPLFRAPSQVFGEAWFNGAAPVDVQQAQRLALLQHKLLCAQNEAGEAYLVYQDAKAAIGSMNRRARKDRHDVAIFSDRSLARLRRSVFVVLNQRRGRLCRALKALSAAEAALAAVAH